MRVSICKDNGEVFAIHTISLQQCDQLSSGFSMGYELENFEVTNDLLSDLKTAIRNVACGNWSEEESE